ncbi:hypothetical protein [Yersinia ruckeri]|uniref:hypothetical protein n=1 Tax=Yersinia ruckeri TaxID=29486 RepID=UPI002238E6EC|nr:hypothetical protein [Yersinia ruckeri]MCW6542993.1 hypothetical protein [Yersinia ruckeri]MCW6591425.1 hypothetical protein [Yersinia ruckeri]UZX90868.1 hypothetical protein ND439_10885 [Yersinia ruckeri]
MLTLTLGNQETTLNERDVLRLIEGMMLTIKDPVGVGQNGLTLGKLTITPEVISATTSDRAFKACKTLLTHC